VYIAKPILLMKGFLFLLQTSLVFNFSIFFFKIETLCSSTLRIGFGAPVEKMLTPITVCIGNVTSQTSEFCCRASEILEGRTDWGGFI